MANEAKQSFALAAFPHASLGASASGNDYFVVSFTITNKWQQPLQPARSITIMILDHLKYTKTHEWVKINRNHTARIGITEYGHRRFNRILFVQLPEVENELEQFDSFGVIESEKVVFEIYSPLSGKVVSVNEELEDDPSLMQHDPYGDGWMIELETVNDDEAKNLMDSEEYEEYIKEGGADE
ncbi:MAG: glycine cleavage system protein GcvH [Proteobacteria bacterium]|nr:glycine cleavage system protein GcvH [Pseudomonadota bacterium]